MKRFDPRGFDQPVDYPELVDRLEGPLTKFVSSYVHDRHAVQDLVQETFLRGFRNLHRYRGQSSVSTWIYSIARNLCLDYLKAFGRSRLRLMEVDEEEKALPDSLCPDPLRTIEREENCVRVSQALGGLSRENRNLVILRVYLGLRSYEIARRCRGSSASVRSRVARALKTLSEGLQ